MRAVADFFDENGIDPSSQIFDISFDQHWGAHISIYQSAIQATRSTDQIQVRRLKRAFGPFVEEGKPPFVQLNGGCHIQVEDRDPYEIKAEWVGAFACEKIGTTPLIGEEAEQKRKEDRTSMDHDLSRIFGKAMAIYHQRVEVLYDCKPVQTLG